MKSRSRANRVNGVRNTIVAFVVVVAILVIGYGTVYTTGTIGTEIREGDHYTEIDDPPPHRPGAPITVTEFFSYGCVHCRNFDPLINDWRSTLPEDTRFERAPVSFSPLWGLLASAYVTLETLNALDDNHDRLFNAIHVNRKQFLSADMLADYFADHGVDREAFLRTFESAPVRRQVADIESRARELGVRSVPTLVVDDRYVVNMDVGRKQSLEVVDHLLRRIRETR